METNSKISVEKSVKLYEKAQDSFKRNNFDYAINILLSVIKCAPQFVKARHLLHLIARKRLEKHKLIILQRIIGTIIGLPHLLAGLFYYAKQEYVKAAFSFEKTILHDPANPLTLSLLGECAWKLDMPDTAIDVFEMVKDLSPKHTKTLYVLGNLYKDEAHDLEKAKECFSAILCYDKHNQKARKGISDVAALQTIEDGKYDDLSSSFLTKVKSSEFNEITEKKLRAVKSEEDLQILIKDTEQKYREEPSNVKVLIELAGYYREGKDYSKAISCYQEAKRLAPEDYTITRFIMDTETGKIDDLLSELKKQDLNNPEIRTKVAQLHLQRTETLAFYLAQMIAERPTDRELHFQLGLLLYEMNEIDRAIKEFQQAVTEPRFRLRASNYLGLCFSQKKMYDMAEVQFSTALSELEKTGHIDQFTKEVMYNLARVYEYMEQFDKAIEKYKSIYKVDIGFKDVAAKINRTYNTSK